MKLNVLHLRRNLLLHVSVLAVLLVTSASCSVIRVKWDSATDGPGDDWANAYHTITAAIAASAANDEIWVAGDTAHPYYERITLKNAVGLYGGFAGAETTRDQRNWKTSVTILDGSGGGNVVTPAPGADLATVLDGFTVRNSGPNRCIYCVSSSPTIANNTISVTIRGIYCTSSSLPKIINNTILGTGIGITCQSSSSASIISNAINMTGGGSAAISCSGSSPTIANNTVSGAGSGSGFNIYSSSSPLVTNNTIVAMAYFGIRYDLGCSPIITNNIFAFNTTGIQRYNSSTDTGTPVLNNNCVHNPDGINYDGLLPGAGDISVDPLFVDRANGDYHLRVSSPCVGAGLNSAVSTGAVDMDGEPRILPPGENVDIGADEFTYTIGEAKAFALDGHWVYLSIRSPVATTASFPGAQPYFYVEHLGRTSGIRCVGTSPLNPGDTGVLRGVVDTVNDERVLTQVSFLDGTLGAAETPRPLSMPCRSIGGGLFGFQPGILGGFGLNNIGLLVRIAGHVEFLDPARQYMTVSDGSGTLDQDGNAGVRVWAPGLLPLGLKAGDTVTVTGISSCSKPGTDLFAKVLVRTADDIAVNVP